MIGQLALQLYPYRNLSDEDLDILIKKCQSIGINKFEITSDILNKSSIAKLNLNQIYGIHVAPSEISRFHHIEGNKTISHFVQEGDLIFPLSLASYIIGRNDLNSIAQHIIGSKLRRVPKIPSLDINDYTKKEFWIQKMP